MRREDYTCNFGCPIEAAIEAIGGKWKGVILYHLVQGMKRFWGIAKTDAEGYPEDADKTVKGTGK